MFDTFQVIETNFHKGETLRAIFGNLSDTDLRLLRVFKAVVQSGGLSAAELELNIGRSTISRHLKDLELRLGFTLCRRGRGGFYLTEEGEKIYLASERLMLSVQEFKDQVNDLHRNLQGKIVIAMFDKTITNPMCKIAKAIYIFQEEAPNVNVEIQVAPVNSIEKGVLNGSYHIGIIPSHRTSSSLTYEALFEEQMFLYCGKKHEFYDDKSGVKKREIKQCKFVGLSFHSPNMEKSLSLGFNRAATASDQEGVATLISSGNYIGFLPDHYAAFFVKKGSMRKLDEHNYSYTCKFVSLCRKSPKPTRSVQLFLDALKSAHRDVV